MILNEETKKKLSEAIGIPYEQLILMDDDEIQKYIEQKIGKKELNEAMERPSRSKIFRQSMKIRKEQREEQEQEEMELKLPVHKRRLSKEQETR